MTRKSSVTASVPFITGNDTKADAARRSEVEKLLDTLTAAGLPRRDTRFSLSNTMIKVPAKGGVVRVDLSRTDASDVLLRMFDAVWKAGVEEGSSNERVAQAASIMEAFPSLRDTFERIADERIEADRARRNYSEE
ncbi:hypothetical protein G6L37_35110 [Agrobacterium rubi]|nr:hypothetical protein [Agrobacterium rubi]NTF23800.1 hypothetical protein [Agrobacterium rubi]